MTPTTKKIYNMNKNNKIKRTKNTNINNKTLKRKPIKQFHVSEILKETNSVIVPIFEPFEGKYEE